MVGRVERTQLWTSLSFCFPICKMEVIIAPNLGWLNLRKMVLQHVWHVIPLNRCLLLRHVQSPRSLGPLFIFFKLHIKERHKFLSILGCSQLSRKEENLKLFSKVYSMIDKTVWKVPKRHVLPQARAILKTKLTETSLSWNIPDLIIDTCKGSFGTDGFLPLGAIWKKLFLAQVLVLRVSLEHRLRSKILRKFYLFWSQPQFSHL